MDLRETMKALCSECGPSGFEGPVAAKARQLIEPLYRQWEYWEGNSWLSGIGLNWHSSSGRTYIRARYDLEVSTEPPTDIGGSRHTASLTLGFRF